MFTEGAPLTFDFVATLVAAFMNGLLAIPIAIMFGALEQRFGVAERVDW